MNKKSAQTAAKDPDWKRFEEAVAAILQALDPKAKVTHDVHLPDADTGKLRQRDVWVETSLGGHIPIKILVSCKKKKSKLSQKDIDDFIGELRSSGANKGVIYSFAGFYKPALEKAEKVGVSCCTLFENRAPDIPNVLKFSAYCFQEQFTFTRIGGALETNEQIRDLLASEIEIDGNTQQIASVLAARYKAASPKLDGVILSPMPSPPTWSADLTVDGGTSVGPITLRLESGWKVYSAKVEGWLLNGSYSFGNDDFQGSISTPWIDRMGAHPGPGWELLEDGADRVTQNIISCFLYGADPEPPLRERYGF